jgi:hypothetical protein
MQVKEIEAFYEICSREKENVIRQEWERLWNAFIEEKEEEYSRTSYEEGTKKLVSEANYSLRRHVPSSKALGFDVKEGDIVEITFGAKTMKIRVLDVREVVRKNDAQALYEVVSE